MKINVKNVGNDKFVSPHPKGHTLTTNAIDVDAIGIKIEMQLSIPNQRDLAYCSSSRTSLACPAFQMVKQMRNIDMLRSRTQISQATNEYRNLLTAKAGSIGDWFLQLPKIVHLTQTDRLNVHKIQVDAGATILSDIELSREQNEDDFEADILNLRDKYPDKIISPTIDMETVTIGLVDRKVEKILKNGFDRFNVIYRSIYQKFPNWIDLSNRLLGKGIWCNVVGVLPRWHGKERISKVITPFLFGTHSTSLGLPWYASKPISTILNEETLCFEAAPGTAYDKSRAEALSKQNKELKDARTHTISGTFFKKFVLKKKGLTLSLQSFY